MEQQFTSLHDEILQRIETATSSSGGGGAVPPHLPPFSIGKKRSDQYRQSQQPQQQKRFFQQPGGPAPLPPCALTDATVPDELQQSPLYVFAKHVSGDLGDMEMNKLLRFEHLSKEKDTVTMMSVGNTLVSATGKVDHLMKRICRKMKRDADKPDWLGEIIQDADHDLYYPFVALTAAYARKNLSIKPKAGESTIGINNYRDMLRQEEGMFTSEFVKFLQK